MLELYNEEVNDLLEKEGQNLKIKESQDKGFFVKGLSDKTVHTTEKLIELMNVGQSNRKTASTGMNDVSF
jgi:hypothetical protein